MKNLKQIMGIAETPTNYNGLSFMDERSAETFFKLSDREKWNMGYWIEKQTIRKWGNTGIAIGIVVGMIVTSVWSSLVR